MSEIVGQEGMQPAVIEQLNLAFDADQDRLLFKVGLSDNTELAIWITRRIAKSVTAWLQGSQSAVDLPMQVVVMNAQGGLDPVTPKTISATSISPEASSRPEAQLQAAAPHLDFSTQYLANRTSRLQAPMLATVCKVLSDNATQFVLEFSAKEGINAQVSFNAELKIAFGNMLQLAAKEAAWDIGLQNSHFVTPQMSSNQVLH